VIVAELPECNDDILTSSTSDYWNEDAQQKSSLTGACCEFSHDVTLQGAGVVEALSFRPP
jgi:hypothetical protein